MSMQRKRLVRLFILIAIALTVYRFRWGVLGLVGLGPPPRACEDVEVFNAYLNSGGRASAYLGRQPFIKCVAERGSYEMVSALIDRGANVDAETVAIPFPIMLSDVGTTAIYAAVERGDYKIAKLLFENGADINISHATDSPLNLTLRRNRPGILKMFLEADGVDYEFDMTQIASAANDADIEIFKLLFNANIPLLEGTLSEALRNAASTGRLELIKLLLTKGADVNQRPGTRLPSALHKAARGNHLDVAEF